MPVRAPWRLYFSSAAKAEKRPVDFKAMPSSLIHSPSNLAGRAATKAVLALEVHSRSGVGRTGMARSRGWVLRAAAG